MRFRRIWASLLLTTTLSLLTPAQTAHVHTEYMKDVKRTKVETSLLYVRNAPEQFVELQLSGFYKGEKLTKPADKINLSIWSLAKKAHYRGGSDQTLYAVTDGDRWKVGTVSYLSMIGETKKGQDTYNVENRPLIGAQIPVPASARVRNSGGDVNGLAMEMMNAELKPEQLAKIAAAKRIEIQLGDDKFELDGTHMSIVHEFVTQLTPRP